MPRVRKGDVVWVEPKLVAEVEFAEWTHDGRLRAPVVPGPARGQGGRGGATASEPLADGDPRRASACSSSRTSTSSSGRRRGSRRATCSRTTATSRPCSSRTCGPAVHDEALSRRLERQVLLPEGRAEAHARLDPDAAVRGLDPRQPPQTPDDRLPARQRRARAPVDGEHGLHRHEHVVLARRQARRGPTGCSSTSTRRRTSASRRRPGRAARSSRRSTLLGLDGVPEDERLATGSTCSCRSRGGTRTRRRASSRRSSPARSRGRIRGLVDDGVDEGEAPRRADRREPERGGQDDRVGVLGAAAGRARPSRRRCAGTR